MKTYTCQRCGRIFTSTHPGCPYCPGIGSPLPMDEFTKDELLDTIRVLQDMNGELLVQIEELREDLNADLANRRA